MNNIEKRFDFDKLWEAEDVMAFTGWSRPYISTLCTTGRIPHIKGRPTKFVESEVKKALFNMQEGGEYGRRKGKKFKPKGATV